MNEIVKFPGAEPPPQSNSADEEGWPPQSRSVHLRRDTSAGTAIRWTSREASALAR
jgi:hypothetical protein